MARPKCRTVSSDRWSIRSGPGPPPEDQVEIDLHHAEARIAAIGRQDRLVAPLACCCDKPVGQSVAAFCAVAAGAASAYVPLVIDDLYSSRILALAANMPRAGRLAEPHASSEKTSKLCGSTVVVDVAFGNGRVADFAQDVRACALGQAAAAVLGENVIGASPREIELARDALFAMLKGNGAPPEGRFADLAVLQPVKDYPARHASTLLAFEAALEAVRLAEKASRTRTIPAVAG